MVVKGTANLHANGPFTVGMWRLKQRTTLTRACLYSERSLYYPCVISMGWWHAERQQSFYETGEQD